MDAMTTDAGYAVVKAEDLMEFMRHLDRLARYLMFNDPETTAPDVWTRLLLDAKTAVNGLTDLHIGLLRRLSEAESRRYHELIEAHNEAHAARMAEMDVLLHEAIEKGTEGQ